MARLFRYEPVGLDLFDRRAYQPEPGTIVRKVQPRGCPRNGTFGHCYVVPADREPKFTAWGRQLDPDGGAVLVLEASLVPVKRGDA